MTTYGDQSSTGDSPEDIRREIERTRSNLSRDVNALGEAVQPGAVAKRQAQKVGGAAANLKDSVKERIMGSDDDSYSTSPSVGDRVSGAASDLGDRAQDARYTARRKAQGNPLAAGLIALGAGWLVGSMMPASQREQDLARSAMDNMDKAQPAIDKAKEAAQQVAGNLSGPAQEAVSSLKDSAQTAVQNVKAEGQDQAQQVKESAQDSAQTVQEHRQS